MTLRTDLNIVQLPNPIPNWGGLVGARITRTDPDFGTQITRVTDSLVSGNKSLQTADAAQAGIWNHDDTMLICRSTMSTSYLFQFYPTIMRAYQLPYHYTGNVCFSRVWPGILYHLVGTKLSRITFQRINSGPWTFVSEVQLADFAVSLPAGFKVMWTGEFNVSGDDTTFVVGFAQGVQNTCTNVCAYRVGHGFRMLNTVTGKITGNWGDMGTAVITSTNTQVPFTVHEAVTTPNSQYAAIAPATTPTHPGSLALFWDVPTVNLRDSMSSGHSTKGFLHGYFGGPGGGQFLEVSYADPTKTRLIVPANLLPANNNQVYKGDQHSQFGLVDPLDNSTFWVTSSSLVTPFTSAWANEVRGYNAQTGVVSRACHTFNSGKSLEFIVQCAIGCPSQTGRFVAFTSDMMGSLGSTTGAAIGNLGVDARGDVFIVAVS